MFQKSTKGLCYKGLKVPINTVYNRLLKVLVVANLIHNCKLTLLYTILMGSQFAHAYLKQKSRDNTPTRHQYWGVLFRM